ncbi:MAG: 5-formyltetrahydrofolate cyclo-ligase [Porcipelethomonas sp.]
MSETNNIKNALRCEFKMRRRKMDINRKHTADRLILENIKKCSAFEDAETVLIFKSTDIETGTELIIDHCFKSDKRVALPRCGTGRKMDFYYYNEGEKLEISKFGIAEPFENAADMVTDFEGCICIVPGLAFDKFGYRLGYGGGYYDRFLAEKNVISVGICYCDFIVDKLPVNEFDKRTDFLVTEKYVEGYDGK